MKKTIVALLCAMLCMCLMIPALAEEATPSITCTTEKTTLNPGDEFIVYVTMADFGVVKSGSAEVEFAADVLKLKKAQWTDVVNDYAVMKNFNVKNKQGVYAFDLSVDDDEDGIPDVPAIDGTVLKLTFTVLDNAVLGETSIGISGDVKSAAEENIAYDSKALIVNIVCPHTNSLSWLLWLLTV